MRVDEQFLIRVAAARTRMANGESAEEQMAELLEDQMNLAGTHGDAEARHEAADAILCAAAGGPLDKTVRMFSMLKRWYA